MASLASRRLLTLRDPLAVSDERRARPCRVSVGPAVVLRCAGHTPTRIDRDAPLPPLGVWDACAHVMCGQDSKAWHAGAAVLRKRARNRPW